jgi:large subunit ribosomal protein L24
VVPEWMQKADGSNRSTRTVEQAVPLSSVRLVFAYTDPETGIKRDVIASKLLNGNVFHDRHTRRKRWVRYVPGINVNVPWPRTKPKKHVDNEVDTLRVDVETRTFVPTLLRPPMPSSVIDELRNKFGKFRKRHDDEYIQAKLMDEEEERTRKESTFKMLQPMQTIKTLARLALKEERKAKGLYVAKRPKVTAEMLGQAIARAQGLTELPKEQIHAA